MKIVRFGERGREKPGLIDRAGTLRDLSGEIADWTPDLFVDQELARLTDLEVGRLPSVAEPVRFGVPWRGIGKLIAIGMNYTDFAAAVNRPHPPEPVLFTKATSCITGPDDPIVLPRGSTKTDWEVELGVVIGRTARYVDRDDVSDYIAGYTLLDDISERAFQNDRGGTWDKGKGCDTFGPVGPWLVTSDEIGDPQTIDLWHDVNGVRFQNSSTRNMIFPVAELIAYVTTFMTLEPGDILATGTPAGVGSTLKPEPIYLKAGDTIRLGSSRLGIQTHAVDAWRRTE